MRMECSSWKMVEQAKEELQILEAEHPNRFGYLKLELKSFIFYLESQQNTNMIYCQYQNSISLPSSTATTQASTSRKRKKGGCGINCGTNLTMIESRDEEIKHKFQKALGDLKRSDRIDLVLEKAQSCLQKIQELKSSLC